MDKYACLDFLFLFLFYSKCICRDLIACDCLIFLFSVYLLYIISLYYYVLIKIC